MDLESDPNVSVPPPQRLSQEICRVEGFLVSTRISCEDPSSIPEAVPLVSPSYSLSEED